VDEVEHVIGLDIKNNNFTKCPTRLSSVA